MAKTLTLKQRKFVNKLLETRNGTQAALDAYDVVNPNVAKVIASENLTKPNVKRAIELALERVGLNDDYISELLKEATVSGLGQKSTNSDSLRGIEMVLKLKGAFPAAVQKSAHLRVETRQDLAKKSYSEITQELEKLNQITKQLLEDK